MSDPATSHDFASQRAETYETYAQLRAEGVLPDEADVDYFLVPETPQADWQPLAEALSHDGFDCAWVDDDGDAPYLVARLPDQIISAGGIWIGEDTATRKALAHGFRPDGWGLFGDA